MAQPLLELKCHDLLEVLHEGAWYPCEVMHTPGKNGNVHIMTRFGQDAAVKMAVKRDRLRRPKPCAAT